MEVDQNERRILSAPQPVHGDRSTSDTLASAAVIVSEIACHQGSSGHNAADQSNLASLAAREASGPSLSSGIATERGKSAGIKRNMQELSVTLVHGDVIILEGDDFEVRLPSCDRLVHC